MMRRPSLRAAAHRAYLRRNNQLPPQEYFPVDEALEKAGFNGKEIQAGAS